MDLRYKKYVGDCRNLARSLSIYSSVTADLLNKFVNKINPSIQINEANKHTWKYHMNLCGLYHVIDTPIYIKSLDTMEDVLFNLETLENHSATKEYYSFGGTGHSDLLERYPGRALLINGILAPAKMEDVVKAETGTLLNCAYELIEEFEVTLFSKLKEWVKNQYFTRYNEQYAICHEYYNGDFMAMIKLNAITMISNLRLEKCKTDETHSYHIYAYLASNGKLHRYMDYLTRYQQLWLYRNLSYIKNHCGNQDNFEWLIENLLTVRNIPLAEYQMVHDLTKQPTELFPEVMYVKKDLNRIPSLISPKPKTIEEILDLEDAIAPDNAKYKITYLEKAKNKFKYTKNASMGTKLLDSTMIDSSSINPYLLSDILINEWADLSANNRYVSFIKITHPILGDTVYVQAKHAFVLFYYALHRKNGIKQEFIPDYFCSRVLRKPTPTPEDLKWELNMSLLTDEDYKKISYSVDTNSFISINKFSEYAEDICNKMNLQFLSIAEEDDPRRRAELEIAAERMYCDKTISFVSEKTTFYEYFRRLNLNIDHNATESSWADLFEVILSAATGLDKSNKKIISYVQKAMLEILKQLSSYTIRIVSDVLGTDIVPLGFVQPRYMIENSKTNNEAIVDMGDLSIFLTKEEHKSYSELMLRLSSDYTSSFKNSFDLLHKFTYEYNRTGNNVLFYDYLPDIVHDNDRQDILLDSLATNDVIRLLKANKICLFPLLNDTRPSTSDFIIVNEVLDLTYP